MGLIKRQAPPPHRRQRRLHYAPHVPIPEANPPSPGPARSFPGHACGVVACDVVGHAVLVGEVLSQRGVSGENL